MYICVCIKQSPDSASVSVDPVSGKVDAERFIQVLKPADACALEAAVRLKEQFGGEVQALTLGPEDAEGILRAALALGADGATRLWHAQAEAWGPATIATALAAYIASGARPPSLVLCGDSASERSSAIVGPTMAERLALPQITGVTAVEAASEEGGEVSLRLTRKLERGYRELLAARLPVLIAVTSDLNEPRYPSLPSHVAALRAAIAVCDPLPLLAATDYAQAQETTLLEMSAPRPRTRRIPAPQSQHSAFERIGEIIAGGATGRQTRLIEGTSAELARALVQFLREKGFLERD